MDYLYRIIPEHKLIVETVTGSITVEELAKKTDQLFGDPLYDPTYAGIADYRGSVSRMTKVELYAFASLMNDSNLFGEAKWAIIADDPIVVALSHLFQQRVEHAESVGIFSTAEAAAQFVGIPEVLNYVGDDAII